MLCAVLSAHIPILACLVALTACGPSAIEGGFDSANPSARMYAIEQAARQGDQSAVRSIIEQLDCDDPAVRLLAISTLERLTGQTYGYRFYDDQMQRREAIARWVAAFDAGEIDARIQPMNKDSASQPATPTTPITAPATAPSARPSDTNHADQG